MKKFTKLGVVLAAASLSAALNVGALAVTHDGAQSGTTYEGTYRNGKLVQRIINADSPVNGLVQTFDQGNAFIEENANLKVGKEYVLHVLVESAGTVDVEVLSTTSQDKDADDAIFTQVTSATAVGGEETTMTFTANATNLAYHVTAHDVNGHVTIWLSEK
ncbi:MAG: hypothetical protein LBN08_04455 [Lactobacillales bacterium]|jgi:hypothetical protein|nr:hypothetical protein [Lactobacillales bacterium]